MKVYLRFTGFKTFVEMLKHIEDNKYKYKNYEVTSHGWSQEHLHFYEIEGD